MNYKIRIINYIVKYIIDYLFFFTICKKKYYLCPSYKKKSPKMSTLRTRHYSKKFIAHNCGGFNKNQHVKALYAYYVENLISLLKSKIHHKFSRNVLIYWKLSYIAVNNNQNSNFDIG